MQELFFARSDQALQLTVGGGSDERLEEKAVDALMRLHPPAGASLSAHLTAAAVDEHYSTDSLLRRLGEYSAFAHSQELRAHLAKLEAAAAGMDRQKDKRQGLVRSGAPGAAVGGRARAREMLQAVEDSLHTRLVDTVHLIYEASRKAQELAQAADGGEEADGDVGVKQQGVLLRQLGEQKDLYVERLKGVDRAMEAL